MSNNTTGVKSCAAMPSVSLCPTCQVVPWLDPPNIHSLSPQGAPPPPPPPPPWIDDIGGAEGWALLQAVMCSIPGLNRYLSDCKSGCDTLYAGKEKVCSAKNKPARAHTLVLAAFDDDVRSHTVWMPAHKKEEQVGTLTIGHGEPLTLKHILGNRAVDTMAKVAVVERRVDTFIVQEWPRAHEQLLRKAKRIARATVLAQRHRSGILRPREPLPTRSRDQRPKARQRRIRSEGSGSRGLRSLAGMPWNSH